MKKNKIKITLLIIFLFILPIGVNAENISIAPGSTITGSQTSSAGCQSSSLYCYSGAGIRLSLYYYDGKNYNKVGVSHDIWSSKYNYPGKDDSWTSDLYHYSSLSNDNDGIKNRVQNGTDWKTNGTSWVSACKKCTQVTNKYTIFDLSYGEYKKSGKFETTSDWGDYTEEKNSDFRTWINTYLTEKMKKNSDVNTYFKTTIHNSYIKDYYITIEPILRIWVNTDGPSKDNKKNNGYIGTVAELSKIYHYSNYSKALRSITEEKGSFIGDILKATPETISEEEEDKGWGWRVLNQYAYGVGVYKLSGYIEQSCECEDNDYKCAMDYCDSATNGAGRKDCVTKTCGIKDPGFKKCSKSKTTSGATTTCTSSASSSKQSCKPGDANTYYQTICTENSNVYYNDSLPTSLSPGMGFSYSLLLSGTKTCDASFDVDKWNFDYIVSDDDGRTGLENILNGYKQLKKIDQEKAKDIKYDSSNADVSIDIEENIEQKEKRITNKKLKLLTSPNTADITVSNSKDEFKTMIEKKKSKNKTFTSSMSSIYTLPDVCINGATGDIYNADSTNQCKTTNDGPYNKFFTSLKAKTTVNNTTVKITKSSSGMDELTNKCYYQVEDRPLSCVIEKDENIYSLKIYSEYDIDYTKLRYVLSSDPNNENWSEIPIGDNILGSIDAADLNEDGVVDELDAELLQKNLAKLDNTLSKGKGDVNNDGSVDIVDTRILKDYLDEKLEQSYNIQLDGSNLSQEMTIYGKIKYEGKDNISTICSINPIPKNDGGRCIDKYKPTQYDEIMKYCTSNWHTDKDNYISEKSCCDTCSGLNSCKIQYSCSDTRGKEEFCKKQYNPVTEANSYRTCINDCACSDGESVYRPISLSNPFPNNRQSGSNWQGYEANIAPLEKDYKPEYVIELTAEDIKNINEQTRSYNTSTKNAYTDYVSKKSNATGQYVSKFIHETNSSLFCIINGEGTCD